MDYHHWSDQEKDKILQGAFQVLKPRDIKSVWANSSSPFTELKNECESLMQNEVFAKSIAEYLRVRSILRRSVEMFFTYIAMSARANWETDLPIVKLHQKEADAYHIITFAIIDVLNNTIINPKPVKPL